MSGEAIAFAGARGTYLQGPLHAEGIPIARAALGVKQAHTGTAGGVRTAGRTVSEKTTSHAWTHRMGADFKGGVSTAAVPFEFATEGVDRADGGTTGLALAAWRVLR